MARILTDPNRSGNYNDGSGPPDSPPSSRTPNYESGPTAEAFTVSESGRALPIAYGTVKTGVLLIEKLAATVGQPAAWTPSTTWKVGDIVQTGNVAFTSGLTITASAYECTVPGAGATSGTGPSGTGGAILDPISGGGATWKYLQALPYPLYAQNFVAAICEGPIAGALALYWDKEKFPNLAAGSTFSGKPGITVKLGPDAANQTIPAVWDQAGYQHTALLTSDILGPVSGTQQETPDMAVNVVGLLFGLATDDASPADIVNDILTHTRRGVSWSSAHVDASITGTAAGDFRVYCDAVGFRMSMLIDSERESLAILGDILSATNSDAWWSQGKLKIRPLGDQAIPSPVYGSTGYVPTNTAVANLGPTDLLDHDAPVRVSRRDDADCFNSWPIEYTSRAAAYAKDVVEAPDQLNVDKRGGKKRAATVSLPITLKDGLPAVVLSRILAKRSLNVRNTFTFRTSWKQMLLERNDIVTLTDPVMGLSLYPVRILSKREDEGGFSWTAEDYPAGVAAAGGYVPATGDGYQANEKISAVRISAIVAAQVNAGVKTSNQLFGSDFSSGVPTVLMDLGGGIVGGWSYSRSGVGVTATAGINFNTNNSLQGTTDAQNRNSLNVAYLRQTNRTGTSTDYQQFVHEDISVQAGAQYCFSAYVNTERCKCSLIVIWKDAAGANISALIGGTGDVLATVGSFRTSLSNFSRAFLIGVAPVGAVTAVLAIRKFDTDATFTDSWAWICRTGFEEMPVIVDPLDGATRGPVGPSQWAPAPPTVVERDAIRAGAITADKIAANVFVTSPYSEATSSAYSTGRAWTAGEYMHNGAGKIYRCLNSATPTGAAPTTKSAYVTTGPVAWKYIWDGVLGEGPTTSGALLQNTSSTGNAIKCVGGGFKVGEIDFDQLWVGNAVIVTGRANLSSNGSSNTVTSVTNLYKVLNIADSGTNYIFDVFLDESVPSTWIPVLIGGLCDDDSSTRLALQSGTISGSAGSRKIQVVARRADSAAVMSGSFSGNYRICIAFFNNGTQGWVW
jgi:hypothetical protein